MKTMRFLMCLLAAAVVLSAVETEARPGRRGKRGFGLERMAAQLDLTEKQQEKIKAARLENGKKMAQLRADLQVAQLELRSLMDADAPSASAVKAKVAAVNAARSKMMENRVNMQLVMKEILTPEQRKKMKQLRQRRPMEGRRHGMRQGPCWGPGDGPRGPAAPAPGS